MQCVDGWVGVSIVEARKSNHVCETVWLVDYGAWSTSRRRSLDYYHTIWFRTCMADCHDLYLLMYVAQLPNMTAQHNKYLLMAILLELVISLSKEVATLCGQGTIWRVPCFLYYIICLDVVVLSSAQQQQRQPQRQQRVVAEVFCCCWYNLWTGVTDEVSVSPASVVGARVGAAMLAWPIRIGSDWGCGFEVW